MPDLSTADISRALRERLREDGSWRVPDKKTARFANRDPIQLVRPATVLRGRVVLGGMLVLLLAGGAVIAVLSSTSPPTLDTQVMETATQNRASTSPIPELWLTPAVPSDTESLVDTRPPAALAPIEQGDTLPIAVAAAVEPHLAPTPPPVPVIGIPAQSISIPTAGAITTVTERLGNLTVDAQLTRAIAFGVEQQLDISARSDSAPLVGAHVVLRITNSSGTSEQVAPDTDRSGRSSKAWPTYRSVGLNQVRVLISVGDGREVTAQLAFLGANSDD